MHQHAVTSTFEQKSIEIDNFNEEEEKEVKERVDKKKIKRREVAEKNKLLKKKKSWKWIKKNGKRNVWLAKRAQQGL